MATAVVGFVFRSVLAVVVIDIVVRAVVAIVVVHIVRSVIVARLIGVVRIVGTFAAVFASVIV
ncbi:MAG: hypothetical protein ABL996_11105 [Micropepsaceae bacterium]